MPISLTELAMQWRFKTGLFQEPTHGLHEPNTVSRISHQNLYDRPDKSKTILFRTDKHGTIIPSNLEQVIHLNAYSKSVLFCGGSTTESATIQEGKRPPDVFTKTSGINSINAGFSGKDLEGCTRTIDYFLSKHGKPYKIAIATNVNTLMSFGIFRHNLTTKQQTDESALKTRLRSTLGLSLPGLWHAASSIKTASSSTSQPIMQGQGETNMAEGLAAGCCHGAGRFNRPDSGVKLDWASRQTEITYEDFVVEKGENLKETLKKYDFPIDRVYIFIEPSSYGLPARASLPDYRQFLYRIDGQRMGAEASFRTTSNYDKIYIKALSKLNFKIHEIPYHLLDSTFFYDAVHLTPSGAKAIGSHYSNILKQNQ